MFWILSTTYIYAQIKFESLHLANSYNALPKNNQTEISSLIPRGEHLLQVYEVDTATKIRVIFNDYEELAHLGIVLKESEKGLRYQNEKFFLENLLLNIFIAGNKSFVFDYIEYNDIKVSRNNLIFSSVKISDWHNLVNQIVKVNMFLDHSKSSFNVTWMLDLNNIVTISFPTKINLIKNMSKDELEKAFVRNIDNYICADETFNIDFKKLMKNDNGLYVYEGKEFGTDAFRSNNYWLMKDKNLIPVFSEDYPIESFINIFLAGRDENSQSVTTIVLYPGKRITKIYDFRKLNCYLKENTEAYFGLSLNDDEKLGGTVIYYNPLYKYINMLVVEAKKEEIFTKELKQLNGTLYLFIPRDDRRN